MIKYHGTPLTPQKIFIQALKDRNVLVSFANPQDLEIAIKYCNKIMLDNGAFSFWTKNKEINWNKYYSWVSKNYEKIDYYIIPDVIDGTEKENDNLINEFFMKVRFGYGFHHLYSKAIPVWHIDESLERLSKLMQCFKYIAFGSSGKYSRLGTENWHNRMNDAMKIVCDENGKPKVKIHMLRCLNPKIFTQYPFYSGDSTNLARNHHIRGHVNILNGIEKYSSPKTYKFKIFYKTKNLFKDSA
ncbi:hypothetical protein [Aliarcobacter butzleri]|uniref:hypothetical protein n=1 Tax=Aliarcobacter butzleri TaxID=28197 RepID=UPI003B213D0A